MIKNLCCENIKLTYFEVAILFCSNVPPSLLLGCYCFFANPSSTPHCLLQDRLTQGVKYYRLNVGC